MMARVHFRGPPQDCLRSAAELSQSVLEVSARRTLKGPWQPGWNWFVEVATHFLKTQLNNALSMRGVEEARRYLDSVVISSPALSEVNVRQVVHDRFRGRWFYGKAAEPSDKVKLDAPEIAENGAVVPISVSSTLPDVTSISILVAENPNALAASYRIPAGTMPSVANRLKMAKTMPATFP